MMSIFATNYVVDEETGEPKLIKHLNQMRIDRVSLNRVGGWNKSGKKVRITKRKTGYPSNEACNRYIKVINDERQSRIESDKMKLIEYKNNIKSDGL